MNTSAYFDLGTEAAIAPELPVKPVRYEVEPVRPARIEETQILPLTLVLQDVLFTGSVTSANWTFAISVQDKLWISRKTGLYFGKSTSIKRPVYRGDVKLVNQRLALDISVTAYNMYGDVIRSSQIMQMVFLKNRNTYQSIMQLEQNRNSLTLKFAALLHNRKAAA